MEGEEEFDVVVIGAGIAGIGAALSLRDRYKVVVLEAADRAGGRARDMVVGESSVVACGAEFIHGADDNALLDLFGGEEVLVEASWPDYYYLGKEGVLKKAGDELLEAEAAIEKLTAEDGNKEGTLLQYLVKNGLCSRYLDLADAVYANDWGDSLSELGAKEVAHEQRRWKHGEKYLWLKRKTLASAIDERAKRLLDVRFGVHVSSVSETDSGVVVDGSWRAKAAIVTVPVGPLREISGAASSNRVVCNALKCFVAFNEAFWPEQFWNVVCADSFIPEIWVATNNPLVLVGFVAGKRADRVALLNRDDLKRRFLAQLDTIFGNSENSPRPATEACVAFDVKDWSKDPLAQGAYTAPTPGVLEDEFFTSTRQRGRIYVAGEATNPDLNPCLQGALESGRMAAARVASLIN